MDILLERLKTFGHQLGVNVCAEFEAESLTPEQRIRDYCIENRCGNYHGNYMCPPYGGSLAEIGTRLGKFHRGILLQYTRPANVHNDIEGVNQTKVDFHKKILQLEDFLRSEGIKQLWGLIGGSCDLCEVCGAKQDRPCPYPEQARTSLESISIDVMALLDRFGLDKGFHPDKITWTGCVLF
ncbi:DUF2284 domain-containing protein [Chloroflexota bacterium]